MNSQRVMTVSTIAALILTATLALATPNAKAFPVNATEFGRTYAQWSAQWWQWLLSIPASINPTNDTTGKDCNLAQSQPLFFLAGIGSGGMVKRSCTVPCGKPLFFPLLNVECSSVETHTPFFGATAADRVDCAQGIMDGVGLDALKASIDGIDVDDSLNHFRVPSPDFRFTMPADGNLLGLPGVTSGSSTSDGYWLMVMPLSAGIHTLHFQAAFVSGIGAGYSQDVTYKLTVKEGDSEACGGD
jgi:hypothetical protein